MTKEIQFFDLFRELLLSDALRLKLAGAAVTGAVIHQAERSLVLHMTLPTALSAEDSEILKTAIQSSYAFQSCELHCQKKSKTPLSQSPRPGPSPNAPAEKMKILGDPIRGRVTPMKDLNLKMSNVIVSGKVFASSCRETRRSGMWVLSFDMTDYSNSVTVRKNITSSKEAKALESKIKPGSWLMVQGKLEPSWDGKDIQLNPLNIQQIPHPEREDSAPVKRVELHLHTKMSNMDALTDTAAAVRQALRWGHPAIAITDHGVVQSFPDAWHAAQSAKGAIKIIYGMEGYFLNNLDDRIAVHGQSPAQNLPANTNLHAGGKDWPLQGEFVCFDIETTSLHVDREAIIEIGAVILRNGEVGETFQTFVNPERHLTPEITGLTGISEEMLKNAPNLAQALKSFLDFAGQRPLAAHNAEFDISFIREGCKRVGLPFQPVYVDSLILAQNLLPNLSKHKLDIVADALDLPSFQHHRAQDDAATVAYMLIRFWKMLSERGISRLSQINPEMETLRPKGINTRRFPKHIILLARNKTGLKNLYQMVSASNLEYFRRVPIIPKTLLNKHREGIIVGSACEAGELFRAVLDHKDWEELLRIASYYDYLEIQPLCNNYFMLRNGTARSEEDLREYNRVIVRLGEELHKPVCATGDVHFLDPEDEIYRHILLASKQLSDANESLPIYFKTTDEMLQEFQYLGTQKAFEVVVTNPKRVADQVENFELLPKELFPPRLENSEEDLNRMVWEKAHRLYGDELPEIITERLKIELGGILGKYDVVYMSAQKLVERSMQAGYLVGSRGSVGSSLAAYMAGITEVNSLPPHYRCPNCKNSEFILHSEYGCGADMPDKICPVCGTKYEKDGFDIPFETFLGFGGGKVPDIDLNFSGEYQSQAHKHAIEMFGETQVFRAGTIGALAEKTAFGFVKKYLQENNEVVSRAEENRLTQGCVGVRRTTGQHPGGLVVVPDDKDMEDFCPIQHPADARDSDIITTHFEYHCMEANILKLDMLGHDDPTIVRKLQVMTGKDPQKIPLDDPDTMSVFTSSKILGYEDDDLLGPTGAVAIPEFNTRFTRQMLVDTQPKNFNTLVRLSGFSHGTDVWLGNARDLIISGTASVLETVGCRDDIMLYLISKGLDPKMSFKIMEKVRKGKVKKGGFDEGWEEAMREHDVPEWYIQSLAKIGYLFPKAHAVAYVMMAFRIAWYKVHEPLAFYATFFSIRAKAFDVEYCCAGIDAVKQKIREIEKKKDAPAVEQNLMTTLEVCYEFYLRGFHFETIDIYRSEATEFVITEDKKGLIPPFTSVHGLGEAAALDIVARRGTQKFASIEDFVNCCGKLSQTHIDRLKKLGAFVGMADTSQISLF